MNRMDFAAWRRVLLDTGEIEPLRLGMTQAELLSIFGTPSDQSIRQRHGKPAILKYRDIEFHFDHHRGHCLFLVFSDGDGGKVRMSVSDEGQVANTTGDQPGPAGGR